MSTSCSQSTVSSQSSASSQSSVDQRSFNDSASRQSTTMPPRYLWRVFSERSNGVNTPQLFASAGYPDERQSSYRGLEYDKRLGDFEQQLEDALYGKEAPENPFIFTTVSQLCAIQRASVQWRNCCRREAGEDVQIICIDTWTAEDFGGKCITFHRVLDLMEEFGMQLTARYTNHIIDYADVWVTTDDIIPGQGSFHASFGQLERAGLFDLCPELGACYQGLEKPVKDLRRLWYGEESRSSSYIRYSTSYTEFGLAAKLTDVFRPVQGRKKDYVEPHLFAYLLALKKYPDLRGIYLHVWLHSHGSSHGRTLVAQPAEDVGIPEVDKAIAINARVRKFHVLIEDVLLLQTTLPETHIAIQRQAYIQDRLKHNSELKAAQTPKRAIKRRLYLEAIEHITKKARLEA